MALRKVTQSWLARLRLPGSSWQEAGGRGGASDPPAHWSLPALPTRAQLQQKAWVRTHMPGAHYIRHRNRRPKPRRSVLARALAAAAKATGLALIAAPAAGAAALVISGRDTAEPLAILRSLPRTAAAVWWGVGSALRYKWLAAQHAGALDSPAYQAQLSAAHLAEAQRLLLLCQQNNGLYVKAGQMVVSLQAAHIPEEYRSVLSSLQDRVPPKPFGEIRDHLAAELGAPLDEAFSEFNEQAVAAASLAQVHQARLRESGRRVAVKVQYPGLEAAVKVRRQTRASADAGSILHGGCRGTRQPFFRFSLQADLATMLTLSRVAAWLFPTSDFRWLFEELARCCTPHVLFPCWALHMPLPPRGSFPCRPAADAPSASVRSLVHRYKLPQSLMLPGS